MAAIKVRADRALRAAGARVAGFLPPTSSGRGWGFHFFFEALLVGVGLGVCRGEFSILGRVGVQGRGLAAFILRPAHDENRGTPPP